MHPPFLGNKNQNEINETVYYYRSASASNLSLIQQSTPMAKARLPLHVSRYAMAPMPTRSWNWLPHRIPASTSLPSRRCGDTASIPFAGSTGNLRTRSTGWYILTANQRLLESIIWFLVTGPLWCLCTSSSFGANEKNKSSHSNLLPQGKAVWSIFVLY